MGSSKEITRTVRFLRYLSDIDRWRRLHHAKQGAIIGFAVQYEAFIAGDWRPIVRYDTAHGFAHRDLLHHDGTQEKTFIASGDYGRTLKAAETDIKQNWQRYRNAYEKEMKKYDP